MCVHGGNEEGGRRSGGEGGGRQKVPVSSA